MSRLRFKVGDLVRLVGVPQPGNMDLWGQIGEIAQVGPWPIDARIYFGGIPYITDDGCDYIVALRADAVMAFDHQLAPLDPPAEPASLTRRTDLEEPATA